MPERTERRTLTPKDGSTSANELTLDQNLLHALGARGPRPLPHGRPASTSACRPVGCELTVRERDELVGRPRRRHVLDGLGGHWERCRDDRPPGSEVLVHLQR